MAGVFDIEFGKHPGVGKDLSEFGKHPGVGKDLTAFGKHPEAGKEITGCPYYSTIALAAEADLADFVFCPYA
ncbi:hypothetical protein T492DRAFT_863898 [Pavlovales sp. CCMP2436]|nr:hypothetical protein T492DRAFT_863898 [Pavlovales sp. CCMP2436]